MRKFNELGITDEKKGLVGDKIKVERILDKQIIVIDFDIIDSKYDGKCLQMQIEYNEDKRVIFTSAKRLISTMERVDKQSLPFSTIIKKQEDDTFKFT
jgi:hypothetical protein